MEADTERERLTPPPERELSAWELVDEEWEGRDDAPMCM